MIINPYRFASAISYLLRATFTASDQPFTNGQVLDTGAEGIEDGVLTIVGTGASISSGFLLIDTTPVTTFISGAIGREIGLACLYTTNTLTDRDHSIGFFNSATPTNTSASAAIRFRSNQASSARLIINNTDYIVLQNIAASTVYDLAIIVGGYDSGGTPYANGDTKADFSYGCAVLRHNGLVWVMEYKLPLANDASLYVGGADSDSAKSYSVGDIRVPDADLSALLEPHGLSASVSTADTFVHISDCLIEVKVTTLPSSGNLDIEFRRQDDNNKWICRVTSAGAISLAEVVSGVETNRIAAVAGAVGNGNYVVILADDDDITIFSNNQRRGAYASATNFSNDTGGKIVFGSGAVAHIADWALGTNGEYAQLDDY